MWIVTQMLRTLALESSAITSVIGERISIGLADQSDTYPCIVMDVISREESPTQDAGSAVDIYRVQVDFYAKNTAAKSGAQIVTELSEAFRIAVDRKYNHPDITGYSLDGIQGAGHASEFDAELQVSRIINDYRVRLKRI